MYKKLGKRIDTIYLSCTGIFSDVFINFNQQLINSIFNLLTKITNKRYGQYPKKNTKHRVCKNAITILEDRLCQIQFQLRDQMFDKP